MKTEMENWNRQQKIENIQQKMKNRSRKKWKPKKNKLASLGATLVRNSADPLTDSLTGVKCRATSVANKKPDCAKQTQLCKKIQCKKIQLCKKIDRSKNSTVQKNSTVKKTQLCKEFGNSQLCKEFINFLNRNSQQFKRTQVSFNNLTFNIWHPKSYFLL